MIDLIRLDYNYIEILKYTRISLSAEQWKQLIGSCLPNAMNENCTKTEAEATTQLQPAEAFTRQIIDWQPQRCIPRDPKIQRYEATQMQMCRIGRHSLMIMTPTTGHRPLFTLFWPPLTLKSGNLQSLQLVFISWPRQTPRESSRAFSNKFLFRNGVRGISAEIIGYDKRWQLA